MMNEPIAALNPASSWRCYASAVVGFVVWLLACVLLRPEWAASLLLLGPLAIVPLGLALLDFGNEQGQVSVTGKGTILAQMISALFLVVSFSIPQPGLVAAALALPWLGFTFWIAGLGTVRLVRRRFGPVEAVCLDIGMLFLAVGGLWTIASRFGARPMGFTEPIILLTGAHFHFAGFALPLLTGLAGRSLRSTSTRVAAVGVMAGVPLVALGITVGSRFPLIEALAAWEMTAACVLVGIGQLQLAARPSPWIFRMLLAVSGLALLTGMALAATYALGMYLRRDWLDIPTMVRWHATINALGFALPGLLAWSMASANLLGASSSVHFFWRFLGKRLWLETWEARPIAPAVALGPQPGDAQDAHERVVAQESPGRPETDGPFQQLSKAIRGYRIFPENMLERVLRRDPVETGDTVVGCYHLFPGIDLILASRVTAVFDEKAGQIWRAGFTYQTLRGHPELGEETFSVEKEEATGRITVALRSWSRPGAWLTWLVYPYARRCQLRAGRAALDHLEKIVKQDRRQIYQDRAFMRSK